MTYIFKVILFTVVNKLGTNCVISKINILPDKKGVKIKIIITIQFVLIITANLLNL